MSENKKISAVGMGVPATDITNNYTEIINQAIEKINPKSIKNANRYMKVVAEPVAKALHGFLPTVRGICKGYRGNGQNL